MRQIKLKKTIVFLFLFCITIHFKNGEVKSFPYREAFAYSGGFGAARVVEFYNNANDNMVLSPDVYYYYEQTEC